MEYQRARDIRGRSLSSLIRGNLSAGSTVTSSVKRALSQKIKARGTGIKEKFDPLNIVRFMTGGSKLATTVAGKLTGRKSSDIKYFTDGRKANKTYSTINKPVPGQLDASSVGLLSDILNFMKRTHEDDIQRYETERAFQEEKENEEQRRHDNFISVLQQYVDTIGLTPEKKEKEDTEGIFSKMLTALKSVVSGIFDSMKNIVSTIFKGVVTLLSKLMGSVTSLISTLFSGMKKIVSGLIGKLLKSLAWLKIFKSVGKIGKFLKYLSPFMKNLLKFGATLLPFLIRFGGPAALAVGLFFGARRLLEAVKDATPNMKSLSPEEAFNVLQKGNIRDIMKEAEIDDPAQAYKSLVDIVKTRKRNTQALLDLFRDNPEDPKLKQAIRDQGGLAKLQKIAESPDMDISQIPTLSQILSQMPERVTSRELFAGTGSLRSSKLRKWDQENLQFYDPESGRRTDLMDFEGPLRREVPGARIPTFFQSLSSSQPGLNFSFAKDAQPIDIKPFKPAEPKITPDLTYMPDYSLSATEMQGVPMSSSPTIINRSSNPVKLPNMPIPVAADVRNNEPTLDAATPRIDVWLVPRPAQ